MLVSLYGHVLKYKCVAVAKARMLINSDINISRSNMAEYTRTVNKKFPFYLYTGCIELTHSPTFLTAYSYSAKFCQYRMYVL